MRALNNARIGRKDCPASFVGVSGWGPNINIQRDPRWGRSLEVPTEDPYLAGQLGAQWTNGVQGEGEDPNGYVKILGSLKHFSVYSLENSDGQNRFGFNPTVALRDMGESYLPAFKAGIVEGKAHGMMCSYTSVNGTAFCESETWMNQWARRKHGFDGNIVTDCGALSMPGPEAKMDKAHNAAKALKAGADLNCGQPWAYDYDSIGEALNTSLFTEADLDAAVGRSIKVRMLAGQFDPLSRQPYTQIGIDVLGAPEHHALALDVALQGLVLLQNPARAVGLLAVAGSTAPGLSATTVPPTTPATATAPTLPFSPAKSTVVIGPHALSTRSLLGSYFDQFCPPENTPGCIQTPLDAINATVSAAGGMVTYVRLEGCTDTKCALIRRKDLTNAKLAAAGADQVVLLVGIDQKQEGEGHDRKDTLLPGSQGQLIDEVLQSAAANGTAAVVVMLNGGIVSIDSIKQTANQLQKDTAHTTNDATLTRHSSETHAGGAAGAASAFPAVVEAWYPGVLGAKAIAQALFGVANRWGKLPSTIYASSFSKQVKMLEMSFTAAPGRTYKYFTGDEPLWRFGTGLSYTTFELSAVTPSAESSEGFVIRKPTDSIVFSVAVANTGARMGDQVVMLYHAPAGPQSNLTMVPPTTFPLPKRRLVGFTRLTIAPSAMDITSTRTIVDFNISGADLGLTDINGDTVLYPGRHVILVDCGDGSGIVQRNVSVDVPAPVLVESLLPAPTPTPPTPPPPPAPAPHNCTGKFANCTTFLQNIDYYTSDTSRQTLVQTKSAAACCAACRKDAECQVFAWANLGTTAT
jgi:beta-glucosidase-like glycosyl hydrolase